MNLFHKKVVSQSFKIGLVLAAIHFVCIVWFVIGMARDTSDGQWGMAWTVPGYIDFPVSVFYNKVLWHITPPLDIDPFVILPYPIDDLHDFMLPSLFYIIVGTLWYLYLPTIIEKTSNNISNKRVDKIIVCLLIIAPTISAWLEFVLGEIYSLYNVTFCIQVSISVLWLILLTWLLAISKKKRVLWLLCLYPFVIWFSVKNILFYFEHPLWPFYTPLL